MTLIIDRAVVADFFGTFVESGYIIVNGGRVEMVGKEPAPAVSPGERIDAEGRLITPGLVNAHAHLYSTLARGIPIPNFSPKNFLEILEGLWWKLDRALDLEGVYYSALIGALEHLRAGVTALFDHHASPAAIAGSLSQIKAAMEEVGLRADLCYEVTDRGGELERDAGIEENLRFAREEAVKGKYAAHMGLHASFTLSDETLERAFSSAQPLHLPFHIHLAEGKEDPVDSLRKYGLRTAERLEKFGILTAGTLLAHGVQLVQAELELLADQPATVIHNPRSNMNNAVGAAQVEKMLTQGVQVGIGTDGFGCDILGELLAARLISRHAMGNPTALGDAALLSLVRQNYALAEGSFGVPMGKIAPGYVADLVIWDYNPPTPLSGENLLSHLLFAGICEGLRPYGVIVDGKVRLWAGKIVGVDEQEAFARAREVAKKIWARL